MARNVPYRATDFLMHVQRLQEGDQKHQADHPVPTGFRARLDKAQAALAEALSRTVAARAAAHAAEQAQKAVLAEARESAAAVRKIVYATYTEKDKTVEDYGLTTRAASKRKKKSTSDSTSSASSARPAAEQKQS